jgi:hypothetical protein
MALGPYLGILACRKGRARMPGIAGQTVDRGGGVLGAHLQGEQHIRREKATSNICTNQGCWRRPSTWRSWARRARRQFAASRMRRRGGRKDAPAFDARHSRSSWWRQGQTGERAGSAAGGYAGCRWAWIPPTIVPCLTSARGRDNGRRVGG